MIKLILNRILVELEEIKKEHDLGNGQKMIIEYGEYESRHAASVTEGKVLDIGPDAYKDWGYDESPLQIGDRVQFAKFSPRPVVDPDEPKRRLAVLNDEDVIAIIR